MASNASAIRRERIDRLTLLCILNPPPRSSLAAGLLRAKFPMKSPAVLTCRDLWLQPEIIYRWVTIFFAGPWRLSYALPKVRSRLPVFCFLLGRRYRLCRSAVCPGSLAAPRAPRSCPLPFRISPWPMSSTFSTLRVSNRRVPVIVGTLGIGGHTQKRVGTSRENWYQPFALYGRHV